jgi:RNA polymerase sigma-70 factor (ECF subfamily)
MASGPKMDSGDAGDFGKVAEIHRPMLLRRAMHLAGNAEIAKDLVQETLLRGFRRFHKLQHGGHAGAWLMRILTNLFYDYLKHQRVVSKAEPELATSEADDDQGDSIYVTIGDDRLHTAIHGLEPELREVVELCYLRQMRYREVAAQLNVPVGTIGTRLMRARLRLRSILDPDRMGVVS